MMFIRDLPPQFKHVLIVVGGFFLLWILYSISAIIAPFLLSIVAAYILNPVIRGLEKIRLPRPYGVLTLFIFAAIAGILVVVPITLTIVSEAHDLVLRLSNVDVRHLTEEYKIQARGLLDRYSQNPWMKNYIEMSMNSEKVQEVAAKVVIMVKDIFIQVVQKVVGFGFAAFSSVVGLFFVPLLTFYLLVDLDAFYQNLVLLIPPIYRNSFLRIAGDVDQVLSGLIRGQIIACAVFGMLMTVGLWLAGLNFFLVLGPVSGIANTVPYLGGLSTIAMSLCVAISQFGFTQSLIVTLIKIAAVLIVVQTIDGFVLQPKVIGENAGLHPLVVMFALVLSGSLFGFLGMLLAIPGTCILKVLSRELYHELYDQTDVKPAESSQLA